MNQFQISVLVVSVCGRRRRLRRRMAEEEPEALLGGNAQLDNHDAASRDAGDEFRPHAYPWESDYVPWRKHDTVSLEDWTAGFPQVRPMTNSFDDRATCVDEQAVRLQRHVMEYRSPRLADISAAVRAELDRRGLKVMVSIFWGRDVYADLLWSYLERNLRSRNGVVDKVGRRKCVVSRSPLRLRLMGGSVPVPCCCSCTGIVFVHGQQLLLDQPFP